MVGLRRMHMVGITTRYRVIIGISLAAMAWAQVQAATSVPSQGSAYQDAVLKIQRDIEGGHLEAARSALTAALREFPSDGGLENLAGVVDAQEGHIRLARREFAAAIQHDPSLISAYLNLGRMLMSSGSEDLTARQRAVHLYEDVLRRDPSNGTALFELAILLEWRHQYRASLENILHLPQRVQQKARVQAVICADQAGLGNRNAERHAALLMESDPHLTEQDVMLAFPELRIAHQATMIATLLTAANQHRPLSIQGLRLLGLAEEAEGKLISAQTTLKRVYAMDPSSAVPLVDLTRIALEEKDYKAALGYLAHARALEPENASFAYEYGLICVKLGLLDETITAMHDAVQLAPGNPSYNLSLGIIASFGANPSEAIPYLQKYHAMRPKDPTGLLALGTGLFRDGQLKEASLWRYKAARFQATEARARYYLGRILNADGHYHQALDQLLESVNAEGVRADVYTEIGKAYMHLKAYGRAEKALNMALSLDANSYSANLALLRLYSFMRDPRRTNQLKRFLAVRKEKQKAYLDALRTVNARPLSEMTASQSNTSFER